MSLVLYICTALFGLLFGSFAGAMVWRLRARQVVYDEAEYKRLKTLKKNDKATVSDQAELDWLETTKASRTADIKRLKPLLANTLSKDRSQCLHCHHELAWYDLLPLVSWITSRGKCRYCKKPIGVFEPLIELGTAILFVFTYQYVVLSAPVYMTLVWLIIVMLLVILVAYDYRWLLLPDRLMVPLIALALAYATYGIATAAYPLQVALGVLMSVMILSGIYLLLWLWSKGRLVGFGDIKLGLALGLLLMDWQLAILALFLANLIGTIVVLPGLILRKLSRQSQIPFGPFLVLGFFIALFWGKTIIEGYGAASIWLTSTLLML